MAVPPFLNAVELNFLLIAKFSNVSRLLSVVSCDYIFKHLDEVPGSRILFCYLDDFNLEGMH
jgi:hypothetical protein